MLYMLDCLAKFQAPQKKVIRRLNLDAFAYVRVCLMSDNASSTAVQSVSGQIVIHMKKYYIYVLQPRSPYERAATASYSN